MMNKVLVIGGSGFIGSHTADMLSSDGYSVTIFDREKSPWLRHDQTMLLGDVMDTELINAVMHQFDCVYFFAGISDIAESKNYPKRTIELNLIGLINVLEAATKTNVKKFVYASTMYVYSQQGSFYRISKQAGESIVEAYHQQYGIEYLLLRYGSVYGPRAQHWNGVKSFVQEAISQGCINYSGDGSEVREYIYVCDAARLSVQALKQKYSNQALTITGLQSIKVSDIFAMIREIGGQHLEIKYSHDQVGSNHYGLTPYRYSPDKAIKLVPTEFLDLGQGILEVIEEIHNNVKNDS